MLRLIITFALVLIASTAEARTEQECRELAQFGFEKWGAAVSEYEIQRCAGHTPVATYNAGQYVQQMQQQQQLDQMQFQMRMQEQQRFMSNGGYGG